MPTPIEPKLEDVNNDGDGVIDPNEDDSAIRQHVNYNKIGLGFRDFPSRSMMHQVDFSEELKEIYLFCRY